ncbi:hypothetical protein [Halopseudomonas salegens]|uniref:Uncharacterized protein n=1 Tax=Halopseudomonas salegens TaxID=1434072 RepID=A0A1H2HW86_9GAMM|nr:hypothetical protein [Halopseudomonas salegens]SDU35975.1 hypothetical protein SAMN05216210_3351 [Halopseudomonas salegens]
MLLSISSSRGKRYWLLAAVSMLGTIVLILALAEWYWARQGYLADVVDSRQLWALQRDKAHGDDVVAFLGASRTQYGVDLAAAKTELPGWRMAMLAINGHYPLATLRDLAEDTAFKGRVVVDVDARGLAIASRWDQQPWVDYYHAQWTPAWALHRRLLSLWQEMMAIGSPELGALPWLRRTLDAAPAPWKSHADMRSDRTGALDFTQVDQTQAAAAFAAGMREGLRLFPPPPAEQWLADLAEVAEWIRAIEQRGGRVVLYEPPVSGQQKELADAAFPRSEYWDQITPRYGIETLTFRDVETLQAIDLPDESHVAGADRAGYTKALIEVLRTQGFFAED